MKSLMLKAVMLGSLAACLAPFAAFAVSTSDVLHKACNNLSISGCSADSQKLDAPAAHGTTTYLQDLLNVFFLAVGIVAVIFLIIGGIRYITSTGDPSRIKSAKDTVLYAVIGLIVAILAIPISGYVIKTVGG